MTYPVECLGDPLYPELVLDVNDPWPREGYIQAELDGEIRQYDPREGGPPYEADWVDPDSLELVEDDVDLPEEITPVPGPQGPQGETGPTGPQGDPGRSPIYEGEWDADTTYDYLDIVIHEGASWISLQDLNDVEPSTDPEQVTWGLLSVGTEGPEGPAGPAGADGPAGPPGPAGSPLPARETIVLTTGSLATNASETGTVTVALGFRILHLQTSRAAWTRLYTSASKQAADAARGITEDPAGDHGVTFEGITEAALLAFDTSPVPQSYNMETPPTDDIPYRVTNLGAAGTVTVTLTIQKQET